MIIENYGNRKKYISFKILCIFYFMFNNYIKINYLINFFNPFEKPTSCFQPKAFNLSLLI